jgi:hypothetical protein
MVYHTLWQYCTHNKMPVYSQEGEGLDPEPHAVLTLLTSSFDMCELPVPNERTDDRAENRTPLTREVQRRGC